MQVNNFDNVLVPNVYTREKEATPSTTPVSIGVVGTCVQAIRGPVGVPVEVNGYADFVKKFGGYTANLREDHMFVYNLFAQNVSRVKVVRVTDGNEKAATGVVSGTTFRLTKPGSFGNSVTATITPNVTGYFDITFSYGAETYTYAQVTLAVSTDDRYLTTVLDKSGDEFVEIAVQGSTNPVSGTITFTGGSDGTLTGTNLLDTAYVSTAAAGLGLFALGADKEVELVALPRANDTVNAGILAHCTNTDFSPRLGIMAPAQGTTVATLTTTGMASYNSDKVVMAYPFVQVRNPFTGKKELYSPTAFYAGLLSSLGYHQSPSMNQIQGVIGLERALTDGDLRTLTAGRVSPLVLEPGFGFIVRNGITTSSNPALKSQTTRRAKNYFIKKFETDLRQFVSKPHTEQLRNDAKSVLGITLSQEERDGKIGNPNTGASYSIKCDAENNPIDVIRANKLMIDVQISLFANADLILMTLDASEAKILTI